MKLVLASSNLGKVEEFRVLFQDHPQCEVSIQQEHGVVDVEETGLSFVENAIIKARNAAAHAGLPALGDDSGLVVHALGGAPGIYSKRYAGVDSSAQEKIKKLLQEMRDVPADKRHAFYYCVLALVRDANDPVPVICEAALHGEILMAPRGVGGFGYDPIFYITEKKCTVAELPEGMKNKISHRALAMQQLLRRWPHIEF